MDLLALAVGALVLGFVIGLFRPAVSAAVGPLMFLTVGSWWATRDPQGEGEPITGVAAFAPALALILLPWLIGAGGSGLVRRLRGG